MSVASEREDGGLRLRVAEAADAVELAALINAAYIVEAFFKVGDRTSAGELLELMSRGGFLLLESEGRIEGAVYVEVDGGRGYFGMLSIAPRRQKQGLGRRLVDAAENYCRQAGCTQMELLVVNLRTELPPYYRKLGYMEAGTRPFTDPDTATQPCHFVVMRKPL
jgi:ribosomal protein S18 acetylase RimI-like enzyme